jgi:hypothetical protein
MMSSVTTTAMHHPHHEGCSRMPMSVLCSRVNAMVANDFFGFARPDVLTPTAFGDWVTHIKLPEIMERMERSAENEFQFSPLLIRRYAQEWIIHWATRKIVSRDASLMDRYRVFASVCYRQPPNGYTDDLIVHWATDEDLFSNDIHHRCSTPFGAWMRAEALPHGIECIERSCSFKLSPALKHIYASECIVYELSGGAPLVADRRKVMQARCWSSRCPQR